MLVLETRSSLSLLFRCGPRSYSSYGSAQVELVVEPGSKTALIFRTGAVEIDSSLAVLVVPDHASFSIQRQLCVGDQETELYRFAVLQWHGGNHGHSVLAEVG